MKKIKIYFNKVRRKAVLLMVMLLMACGGFMVQGAQTDVFANTLSGNDIDTTPISTSDFIMVGGDWVTPTAVHGRTVNVVSICR